MTASSETILYIHERGETAVDSGDGLAFTLYGYDGQTPTVDPTYGVTPLIYVAGVLQSAGYTFNVGSASVHCSVTFAIAPSGDVTVSYKWKYVPSTDEDFTVYAVDKSPNVDVQKDVNGRNMVTEGYERTTNFMVTLSWRLISDAFWRLLKHIAETKLTTFDVYRASKAAPLLRINNLYATTFPRYEQQGSIPCYVDAALEAVQLTIGS